MVKSLRIRFVIVYTIVLAVISASSYLLGMYPLPSGYLLLPLGVLLSALFIARFSFMPIERIVRRISLMKAGKPLPEEMKEWEMDGILQAFMEMQDENMKQIESHRRFTSDVAHEIRSPLTALKGSIEVALRRDRTAEEYRDVLRRSLDEVNRLQGIAENLLLLSRADYNIIEMRKEWFDLNELVQSIVDRLKGMIAEKGIVLREEYHEPLEFFGDQGFIDQAISNLLDNAIKYTPRGGVISIRTSCINSSILVAVSDSGPGIPREEQEKVFQRFYRLDRARSRASGGAGLGLSITQWIIESHGGKITLESAEGRGTTFLLAFPLENGNRCEREEYLSVSSISNL